MADEVEMIEIEMLESDNRRLKSEKQHLTEEKERLRSTVSELETTNALLKADNQQLIEEKERLQSTVSDLEKDNTEFQEAISDLEKDNTDLQDELQTIQALVIYRNADPEAKEEEEVVVEPLFPDIQESEANYMENMKELRTVRKEKEELVKKNEKLDSQIDHITEDNTEIILTILTRQSDLEADLEKQTEIIRSFFQKALEMVKDTAKMIEEGQVDDVDFAEGFPEGLDSTLEMMVQLLAVELAAVKRAFRSSATRIVEMRRKMEKMQRVMDLWVASAGTKEA